MALLKFAVDSAVPETAIIALLQAWRFLSGRHTWGFYLLAWFLGSPWLNRVSESVSTPYLDEVFHIPQAQTYCEGKFGEWDDKITTPPGLYLLAAAYHTVFRDSLCSAYSLRRLNLLGVVLIHLIASSCRQHIESSTRRTRSSTRPASSYAYHTAVNIALFPVLFFFSALFYTDVYSALFVLLAYRNHLSRLSDGRGLASDVWTVCLGVSTLLMRQTNVFWVVVYMGGLEAVHAIRSLKPPAVERPEFSSLLDVARFYGWRYSLGGIYDAPLSLSSPDDWLFCSLSIATAALCNPVKVLKQIWPYIGVAALFSGFVAWNGGVVLGDKSNHVATIHLAQMLYLWPLFAFFSLPLLIPPAMSALSTLYRRVAVFTSNVQPLSSTAQSNNSPTSSLPTASLRVLDSLFSRVFNVGFFLGAAALTVAIVKYNTIVHPFTLADNRHYMFYVFRYTILRSRAVRFALVPAYMVSAYLVWSRLAGKPPTGVTKDVPYLNRPFDSNTSVKQLIATGPQKPSAAASAANKDTAVKPEDVEVIPSSSASPSTSTALLWLATTALSLVSAPLVEPRYFILPWIFWRLLVPLWPTPANPPPYMRNLRVIRWINALGGSGIDLTAVLETAWFVVINVVTFWIFLSRPYQWRGVDGRVLDEERWQRFMW